MVRFIKKSINYLSAILLFIFLLQPVQAKEPVRFGVLSIAPPARIHAKWQPFVEYLSEKLGQDVKIVVPRGFKKMKQAAAQGKVDFFYINSHVFYRLKQEGKAIAVAQMENVRGETTSRSDIFVRKDSKIKSVRDLKGKSIAFVSPMGAGGYLAPRAYLYEEGINTKKEVKELFTKNLSNSIYKVLLGETDAGTMCGVNYNLMSKKLNTGELKIIGQSDPYPENVIAARSNIDQTLLKKVKDIIINMPQDKKGKEVLVKMQSMKIKRFLPYDAKIEAITRKLLETGGFTGK